HVEQPVAFTARAVLDALEQPAMTASAHFRVAEFADAATLDRAAELRRHGLHAIADAKDRHTRGPHRRRSARRVALRNAPRPAREDDTGGLEVANESVADVEGMDLAIDVQLPDAPRDELRVLGAEVEDEDGRVHDVFATLRGVCHAT